MILVCTVLLLGSRKPYKSVSVQAAARMMESGEDVLVVDVRRADEYAMGHVPRAVNIPLDNLREGNFDGLPNQDATLLIYCYAGRRSREAAEILLKAGWRNAYEFGGIVDWTGEIERDGKIISSETAEITDAADAAE